MDSFKDEMWLSPQIRKRSEVIFDRLSKRSLKQGVLLHNDFHSGHIFVEDNRVTGIIDWERALSGDPYYDLAVSEYFLGNQFAHLLKGYGRDIDCQVIEDYRLIILLSKAHWHYENNHDDLPKILKALGQYE